MNAVPRFLIRPVVVIAFACTLLVGCGGDAESGDSVKIREVLQAGQQLVYMQTETNRILRTEIADTKRLTSLQAKLESLSKQQEQLKAQLASLDDGDKQAYDDVLDLQKEGDVQGAYQAANSFLRDYPLSKMSAQAQALAATTGVEVARIAEEKRKAEAAEKARIEAERQARIAKFRSRKMTVVELKGFLAGKSQAEVLELLGDPTARRFDLWQYVGKYAVDETGRVRGINIHFNAGRVQSIGLRPPS